jgi:hypothetical protein
LFHSSIVQITQSQETTVKTGLNHHANTKYIEDNMPLRRAAGTELRNGAGPDHH